MSRWAQSFMFGCAIFICLPIIVVCAAALNGGRSMSFPPQNVTISRFAEFFVVDGVWFRSLQNSLLIAIASAALASLLAWPIAYELWRRRSRIAKLASGAASLPFVLPPIIFGVGLGFMWGFGGVLGQFWVGIVSHALLHMALPLVTITIGLNAIDRTLLDAAATMGANSTTTFRTIIFPQTLAYSLSGFLFALVLSFNEFIVTFFVASSSYSTVTLQIFNSLRNGFTPTMAVGAITFIATSVVVFGFIGRFGNLPKLMGADQTDSH